jgi:hypothetical protein
MAPTGGSALAFSSAGQSAGINTLYATADTDLRTRRSIVATVKDPKVSASAPNGYTQARATVVYKAPLALDNGGVTVNTVRIEFAYDVETSTAEKTELLVIASQICNDADFTELFQNLSLS